MTSAPSLREVLEIGAEYDALRLATYRTLPEVARCSAIERSQDGALVLAFADVGYFNRVHHVDPETIARLDAALAPYRDLGIPHRVTLHAAAGTDFEEHAAALHAAGFAPGASYVRLAATRPRSLSAMPEGCAVRIVGPGERDSFLDVYLRGFEAEPQRITAAKRNMRLLFERDDLVFFLAIRAGAPAGVGMLWLRPGDRSAMFAAGAVVPEQRGHGLHRALIAARFEYLAARGIERIGTWAYADSASHANLENAGFTEMRRDRPWISHGSLA